MPVTWNEIGWKQMKLLISSQVKLDSIIFPLCVLAYTPLLRFFLT